jgi:MFS family permease
MDFYRHLFNRNTGGSPITFFLVYALSVIFTFQMLVTAYSSSTYMERFIAPEYIGLLYAVGAGIAIFLSLTLPRLLRRIGNTATCLLLVTTLSLSLIGMALATHAPLTIIAFIGYLAIAPQIYLNIDVYMEALIGKEEGTTGSRRGLILTLMSTAAFFSPLAMGYIIGEDNNLANVYYVGAAVGLVLSALLVTRFRQFLDPIYKTIRVRDMLTEAVKDTDIRTVMGAQFLLQFFYTWAIVYLPLYLATVVGFDWPTISIIIASGLFAFIIFEYPIGIIADRYLGEKEMMAVGFVILAVASACFSFMTTFGVLAWMCLMFTSRIGASLVEVTTESYFFKKVDGEEPNLIGLFRLMRPLANLLGALIGSIALIFLPFNFAFFVLALVMVSGVAITTFLTDTK